MRCGSIGRATRRAPVRFLLMLGLLLLPGVAQAHEFWLMPSTYFPGPSDTVCITAWVGTGFRGDGRTFSPERCIDFRLLGKSARSLSTPAAENDSVWACIVPPEHEGGIVAYTSNFAFIEMAGEEFDAYLALEGLEAPRQARRAAKTPPGPQRERYRRCLKTWVGRPGSAAYSAISQQPLELIPLTNPNVDRPITFRLESGGRRLAGALVRAWRRPLKAGGVGFSPAERDSLPPLTEGRTNSVGEVKLQLRGPGEYLVSAVHMAECANRTVADWESNWAAFTFGR